MASRKKPPKKKVVRPENIRVSRSNLDTRKSAREVKERKLQARLTMETQVPAELVTLIFEWAVSPDPQTRKEIYEYELQRIRLQQVCGFVRSIILAPKGPAIFWRALYLDRTDPSGYLLSAIPVNETIFRQHIKKAKSTLLSIWFGLRCRKTEGSFNRQLWTTLTNIPRAWGTLLVCGANTCTEEEICLHAMLQNKELDGAFQVRKIAATKKQGEYPHCASSHQTVAVWVAKTMESMAIDLPTRIKSWSSNNLKVLSIQTEADNNLWCSFFDSCRNLEELVWQRGGRVQWTKIATMPSLKEFSTYTAQFLPPINAPNLSALAVFDNDLSFSSTQFQSITGKEAPYMEHLDLLYNPTRNGDIEDIFRRCPNLRSLADSAHETRSSLYSAIAVRGRNQYLRFDARKLEAVRFAHGPPANSHGATAQERYQALCRLAFNVVGYTVLFQPKAQRLVVANFPGDFSFGDAEKEALLAENLMNSEVTRMYDQEFDAKRPTLNSAVEMNLIVLTLDTVGANRILGQGWKYKGNGYKAYRNRPGRQET
ncbi:hypothetical protein R3P38DRAFT_2812124 [Favolaschia claudopus]|uniref:Uncharacterized protein n=1 Tax=Favolaschia claudopus TaxID=2862362 RepID=A0AAV9Z8E5_9AGAR